MTVNYDSEDVIMIDLLKSSVVPSLFPCCLFLSLSLGLSVSLIMLSLEVTLKCAIPSLLERTFSNC